MSRGRDIVRADVFKRSLPTVYKFIRETASRLCSAAPIDWLPRLRANIEAHVPAFPIDGLSKLCRSSVDSAPVNRRRSSDSVQMNDSGLRGNLKIREAHTVCFYLFRHISQLSSNLATCRYWARGNRPMLDDPATHVPFNWPFPTGQEITYLLDARASGVPAGDGVLTKRCNAWLMSATSAAKALLTQSCSAALETAALLFGITPSDEIIMPRDTIT